MRAAKSYSLRQNIKADRHMRWRHYNSRESRQALSSVVFLFAQKNQALTSSIRLLPYNRTMLYYMLDDRLFLHPHLVISNSKHYVFLLYTPSSTVSSAQRVLHMDLYKGHGQHQSLFVSLNSSWYNKNCALNNTILICLIYCTWC
jgi:hypothetical protein